MAKRNPFAAIARGHDLAEAIVDAVREPLLVLGPDLRVIAASRSFYRTFAVTPRKTEGKLVFELGDGQWNIPGLRALLEDIIPKRRTVEAYEVEHEFPSIGRRVMLLNARRVFDEDGSASAILLAIEDVTRRREAEREKDELLQQKEILLEESWAGKDASRTGKCKRNAAQPYGRRQSGQGRWAAEGENSV